jgi:uncharacterized protein YndB with AHSA1/START domain
MNKQRGGANMATSKVSPDSDTVTAEIQIAAPPERVFEALVEPQQIAEWWRNDTVSLEGVELEPRVGGRWGYQTNKAVDGKNRFRVQGEILEYDPPRLLAYTWRANLHRDPARSTVVRWELTPVGGGTRVKLTHSGLAQEPESRQGYGTGWLDVVDRLRRFVTSSPA